MNKSLSRCIPKREKETVSEKKKTPKMTEAVGKLFIGKGGGVGEGEGRSGRKRGQESLTSIYQVIRRYCHLTIAGAMI